MKCAICKEKVATTFLNKILGTYMKDEKGKQQVVCFSCQSKLKTKEAILEAL